PVIVPLLLAVNFTPTSTPGPPPASATVGAALLLQIVHGQPTPWPVEITRFTADPEATDVPAAGVSLITSPDGTVPEDCCVTVPTTKLAPVIAVVAAACVS